jgi:sugar/nucleoside kinase (ribokinase family)
MAGVLCSGNLVCDVLLRPVGDIPHGATVLVERIEQHMGGNASNTSYALGRLGVRARVLGMLGQDAFGEFVLAQLHSAGVDTSFVQRSEGPTCVTVVLVDTRGTRTMLQCLGSSAEFRIDPAKFPGPFAEGMSHYHLASPFGLPLLRPLQPELLRRAREAGLSTSLDAQWDTTGKWREHIAPCLKHVDIFFANEDEARMLTGFSDPAPAAANLRQLGAAVVVIKLGARGCAVFTPDGEIRSPAAEVPVVDTTGAGDCFVAGFLSALERGGSYEDAARLGNHVASFSVQKLGAVEGLAAAEIRGICDETGWRE